MKCFLTVLLCCFCYPAFISAQTNTYTGSSGGNWNTAGNWSLGIVPVAAHNVVIPNNINVTVNTAAVCNTFTINGGNRSNTISISGSNSLTVTGAVTINSPGANRTKQINVGAGSLNCGSVTMASTSNNNRVCRISISSGTVTVSGNITMNSNAPRNNISITGNGVLKIGGTISSTGGLSTTVSSAVEYNGAGAQTVKQVLYGILIFSGSGVKTFSGDTIRTRMQMAGTATAAGSGYLYRSGATLEYKGAAAQVTGSEFPASQGPDNLIINNISGVTLSAPRNISGTLTLTKGLLTTSNTNLLTVTNTAVTAVSTGSDSSFVNGPLAWDVVSSGSNQWMFPVGKSGSGIRRAGIYGSSASARFQFEFFSANPKTTFGDTSDNTLAQVSACEYWDLSRLSGTGQGAVVLTWEPASSCSGGDYVTSLTTLRVAHWTDFGQPGNFRWYSEGQTANTGTTDSGSVTSNTVVSGYSPFAIGSSISTQNPLPLHLLEFSATAQDNKNVSVSWKTADENMSHYTLEHSTDGFSFEALKMIPAENKAANAYQFKHRTSSGVHYYRLRMHEKDGSVIQSRIINVRLEGRGELVLYPNPVQEHLTVDCDLEEETYYTVTDQSGRICMSGVLLQGANLVSTAELPPGLYFFLVQGISAGIFIKSF